MKNMQKILPFRLLACFVLFTVFINNTFALSGSASGVDWILKDGIASFTTAGVTITQNAQNTKDILTGLDSGTLTADALVAQIKSAAELATKIWNGTVDTSGVLGSGIAGHKTTEFSVTGNSIHVACENGAGFDVTKAAASAPVVTPPPAPVVTTSSTSTTGGSCSSYISHWAPSWSTCSINSNWSSGGTITCLQTNNWTPVSSACGVSTITTTTTCIDGSCTNSTSSSCSAASCPANASQPAPTTDTRTIFMNLSSPTSAYNNAYANDYDSNSVAVNISGVTNQNRAIVGWGSNGVFTDFSDASNVASNRIDGGGQALNFSDIGTRNINGAGTSFNFTITPVKSKAPFVSGGNKISFKANSTALVLDNVNYAFKKPFTGYIKTSEDNGTTWNEKPQIGTEMLHKLLLTKKSTLTWTGLLGYSINDFTSAIGTYGEGLEMQSKSIVTSTQTSTSGTQFKARINTSATAVSMNKEPGLQINLPIVTYTLNGQIIKYKLSEGDAGDDINPIKTLGDEFLGVRVIGGIQGAGKSEFTGQKTNISSIASTEMRTSIRQNAYTYIRNMTNGQILNGVKYIEGDAIISGDQSYETLVVKDGNVIIDGNLNTSSKKLGIIVLKDGYDVSSGFNGKGNVYVKPNVTKINAVFYADGALVSVNSSSVPYTTDSSDRTYELNNQLIINGSLFTRNTIGGSMFAGGKYVLPGGSTLSEGESNFNKAMQYDLNYIRRGKVGCDKNGNLVCTDAGEYKEPFVVRYDSRIQTSPVKLFTQQ